MRPSVAFAIPILLATSAAHAERVGGDQSGGRGRLGQVSGGIATATSSDAGRRSGGSSDPRPGYARPSNGDLYRRVWRDCPTDMMPRDFGRNGPPSTSPGAWCRGQYIAVIDADGTVVREYQPPQAPNTGTANVDFFVGAHKVIESDGALSLSLAVDDRWFRIAGSVTRYVEDQMDGSQLTLTMPTLLGGVRVDGGGATRAFLEGGVAIVSTRNDPMADSSIAGAMVGMHAEHRLTPSGRRSLVGDAHAMYFESDVKAYAARVGVRIGYLEAAFRVLDFNVGPALYGPEVGLRF
ncbi:MAG TPA: hypothetical protein VM513_03775 [Kofleriaceae bacterium]|nr:hypothetical protein [Kofleriaceae bacterium]